MGKLKIDGVTVEFNISMGKDTRVSSEKMRKDNCNCNFGVGQVYRVGVDDPEKGNIIKISSIDLEEKCPIKYNTIRGKLLSQNSFQQYSEFGKCLKLLTGKEISDAIKEFDSRHSKGAREVKRHAKAGEYIKTLRDCELGRYKKGDILKVTTDDKSIGNVWRGKAVEYNNTHYLIPHEEYVVLENYKPKLKKHKWTEDEIEIAKQIVFNAICREAEKGNYIVFSRAVNSPGEQTATLFLKGKTLLAVGENKFVADETESATTKCSPNDEFNKWIGKCVAVCRLLDEPIPMFITGQ